MPFKKRSKTNYYFHKYFIIPFKIFHISVTDTIRQDGVEHSGYLAFLIILSLFPFLMFLIAMIGFFGASQIGADTVQNILQSAPKEIVSALTPRISEIVSGPKQSFLTIAIIGVIWTASSFVEGCRTILNRAYRTSSASPYIWRRLVSIVEFLIISFSVVIGIVIFVILPSVMRKLESFLPFEISQYLNFFHFSKALILVLLAAATSLLYYIIPSAKQKFSQTIPGAILAVILWIGLKKCFVIYLNHFDQFNLVYGSLAGIIAALMFFYLASLIFIIGAEFNYHFNRAYRVFLKQR